MKTPLAISSRLLCAVAFVLLMDATCTNWAVGATPEYSVYGSFDEMAAAAAPRLPKAVVLTDGPTPHWFSYYDVYQSDPTDRYLLGMEVDFEHRPPNPDDVIRIGVIDTRDGNRWSQIGTSRAWNWQAGCRLQWRPGSGHEILWNDRDGDHYVTRIHDTKTESTRTLPYPTFHVHPKGEVALTFDFSRMASCRGGYGYHGAPEENAEENIPANIGVHKLDLTTGRRTLLFSYKDVASRYPDRYSPKHKCYFNCASWNPSGTRFLIFLRHGGPGGVGVGTTVVTADADGDDIRFLNDGSSHFCWKNDSQVLIWTRGKYRLFNDDGLGKDEPLWTAPNGHQTYLPGGDWLITDTYPVGKERIQHLYLYHVPTGSFVPLARFHSPPEYRGHWRCDLHPRMSRDGKKIIVDSPHGGAGRQLYQIDIGRILASPPGGPAS